MSNDNSVLDWLEFCAKYLTIAISAIWVLYVGTDYIQKQTAELEFRNLQLSKNSVPVATPVLDVNVNNDPWIGEPSLCTISGKYIIQNKGVLPFQIEKVTVEVYETPVLSADEALQNKVTSRSTTILLKQTRPIHREEIVAPARVGIEGFYSRNFLYVIKRSKGMLYTVVANASGAVVELDGPSNHLMSFGPNELEISKGPISICGGDLTLANKNDK